jgi:uncharacterized protein YdhG (YjbR/CyaY superfamily)
MGSKSEIGINTVEEYFSVLPEHSRAALEQLRQTIKKAAPEAEEIISYQMPAFKFHGILVYYAAFKNHYSLFPKSHAIEVFKEKLKDYETTRGTIHFMFDKPLPEKLIAEIIQFRVRKNLEKKQVKDLEKRKK